MAWVAHGLIIAGLFFTAGATVGLLRLPDFYTRTHAMGKPDTLGGMLILGGLAVYSAPSWEAVKLLLVLVFWALANPAASHALARSARRAGLQPWQPAGTAAQEGAAGALPTRDPAP